MDEPYVTQTPVNVVKEILYCHCGKVMTPTGFVLTSMPAQYPHTCTNGHTTSPPHPPAAYPRINYVEHDIQIEPYCSCKEGPKLGTRTEWAKPRCGRCYLFVSKE